MLKSLLFPLALCLVLAACSERKSPSKVLLPELTVSGETRLVEVRFATLSDPRKVEGPAAIVYENPEVTDQGVHGKSAEPRLTAAGDTWIPMDVKSSSALSVYLAYERLKAFDDKAIPDFSVSWPRRVAFDLNVRGEGFVNNAYYQGDNDVTVILPYTDAGAPITFNSAILAHEHFHAHFYQMFGADLMIPLGKNLGAPVGACGISSDGLFGLDEKSSSFRQILNFFILRGWNEGLADYYAVLFSGNPDFLESSLSTHGTRKVDVNPSFFPSRGGLQALLKKDLDGDTPVCLSLMGAYEVGSQVARSLYVETLGRGKKVFGQELTLEEREAAVRDLFVKLKDLKAEMISQMLTADVEPSWLTDRLLERAPEPPTPKVISRPGELQEK